AEIDEILRDIVRDDKRAGAVISGLRAMMRRRPGERQPVDLSQLVEETVAMLNMNIQTQNVNVQENLETDCTVIADRAQLQQVLVNLIVNAVEAMQSAGVHGRRLFLEVRNGAMVQCAVHDTGKDLRPHRLSQIFEPFWTTKVEGLGMGLAVCRSIINAHDGAIWAEIAQDGGAVFRFELPKAAFHALAPA
ncbi:MAG TPA: ATP-binding protein, partial [Burkholderiales bacterium]